jgi:hypothetical protein
MRSEYTANITMRAPKRAQEAPEPVQATRGWVGFVCTLLGAITASGALITLARGLW